MYLNEFYKNFFGSFENILLSQKTLINQTKSQIDSHTYKFCWKQTNHFYLEVVGGGGWGGEINQNNK